MKYLSSPFRFWNFVNMPFIWTNNTIMFEIIGCSIFCGKENFQLLQRMTFQSSHKFHVDVPVGKIAKTSVFESSKSHNRVLAVIIRSDLIVFKLWRIILPGTPITFILQNTSPI